MVFVALLMFIFLVLHLYTVYTKYVSLKFMKKLFLGVK